MYSKVTQLHIYLYICILFSKFFSVIVYYKILNMVPCTIQKILLFIYFICGSVLLLIPYSQFISPLSQLFSALFKKKKKGIHPFNHENFACFYVPGYVPVSPSLWELD